MRHVLLICFFCLGTGYTTAAEHVSVQSSVQLQREAFGRALRAAEAGDWSRVQPELQTLQSYPLLHDLRGAWLAANAQQLPETQIRAYLSAYPSLYASDRLRLRWTKRLYLEGRWQDFLEQYRAFYAHGDDVVMHCQAVLAQIRLGNKAPVERRALELWLVGHSQPAECDPVFDWLAEHRLLTSARYRQRLELALADHDYLLANYLAKSLTDDDRALVDLYHRVIMRPEQELARQNFKNSKRARALILDGLGNLARRDPDQANKLWRRQFKPQYGFTREQKLDMARTIALWSAQRFQPNSLARMRSLPAEAHNPSSLAWWARAALNLGDWKSVSLAVGAMPDEMARAPVWQYWGARALQAQGEDQQARQMLLALAQTRGYYGFLAADQLTVSYAYEQRDTPANEAVLRLLAAKPELIRAGELFATGLYTRGRQEWDAAIRRLDPASQIQASILASRLNWHSRAIATAARQKLYDDVKLRYPRAFIEIFEESALKAGIDTTWAMGIARSESLFMPDVKSPSGALGLMQLMPATGAATAREFNIPYTSSASLLDPQTNIRVGTRYLGKMQSRFDNHLVLSTAAYNAGPNRISSWLPATSAMAADVWIDTLPYSETRNYVRRVLESQVLFAWSLGQQELRLGDILSPVPAAEDQHQARQRSSAAAAD